MLFGVKRELKRQREREREVVNWFSNVNSNSRPHSADSIREVRCAEIWPLLSVSSTFAVRIDLSHVNLRPSWERRGESLKRKWFAINFKASKVSMFAFPFSRPDRFGFTARNKSSPCSIWIHTTTTTWRCFMLNGLKNYVTSRHWTSLRCIFRHWSVVHFFSFYLFFSTHSSEPSLTRLIHVFLQFYTSSSLFIVCVDSLISHVLLM